jgi:hypothetical protein
MIDTILQVVRAQPLIDRVALLCIAATILLVIWLVVAITGAVLRVCLHR